jgi:RNA polymerase sigma-70 factor (ECF subfamily)
LRKNFAGWRERAGAPIIAQVRDDDFERLYAAHAEALLGFLLYRTGDRSLAEDVVADTFERVLRTRVRFDPRRSSEKTWVYTIALNLLRDRARRQAVESQALERAMQPVGGGRGEIEAVDERDELRRSLERLSPEEREAVALRYGADLTLPEVAKVLGEKQATVHGRVYRGLQKMREELG